jgi:hypothetical protein
LTRGRVRRVASERWPDFYIVGAPKAGTTSLYEYLATHPRVFLPEQKELRYFGSDLDVRGRRRFDQEAFLALYAHAPPDALLGNAYVWYLFSCKAAAEIHAARPDARIVIMLREPVAALHALHSEFVYDGNEDLDEFAEALAAEPDRCAGRRIPGEAHFPEGLCYRSTVRYAEQVQRYLGLFGPTQVHVGLFDDFVADADAAGERVLSFMGLSPEPGIAFPHRNPNKRARSALVRRLLANPPVAVRRVIRAALPGRLRRAAYRHAVALNAVAPGRADLAPDLRRTLRLELEPEVKRLERLLGRELPAWHEPA